MEVVKGFPRQGQYEQSPTGRDMGDVRAEKWTDRSIGTGA